MTRSETRLDPRAPRRRAHPWLGWLVLAGCGSATVQQGEPAHPPAAAPASEVGAESTSAAEAEPEGPPAPAPLPPEVASLLDPEALARYPRRAWVERGGATRFVRDGATRPAGTADFLGPVTSHVVVDVVDDDVRVVHQLRGVYVLVWVHASDLTSVPTEVVSVRPTQTAGAPASDNVPAVRLQPGFRLRRPAPFGDLVQLDHADGLVAFRGFVPAASLGPVYVPAPPRVRDGEGTRLRSNAALRDRPSGRVIAQFSPRSERVFFEHNVIALGPEERGHRLVAYVSPDTSPFGEPTDERLEVVGWARTRDLGLEPWPLTDSGIGRSFGHAAGRSTRITLAAGTPILDVHGGSVIGVVRDESVVVGDPAPEGGFVFDLASPWGRLSLYVASGNPLPAGSAASSVATPAP